MKYRQGRHRPRNVYRQHGHVPSDDDVFVALFDDPYDAADYCRLKNAQENIHLSYKDMRYLRGQG